MTDEELLAFIRRIREMCDGDGGRMQSAFSTLQGILMRQHADDASINLVGELQDYYVTRIMCESSTPLAKTKDLHAVIDKARERRAYDDAHRGCR